MIYRINKETQSIEPVYSTWNPKELEVENYILSGLDEKEPVLESPVFGEPFLIINHQVTTDIRKRADILAIDKGGNAVIIELKRESAALGVDTQALQYLAEFSAYKGKEFIKRHSKDPDSIEESIIGFLGDEREIKNINQQSRIILVARGFDTALFSMGEWLSGKGVAFRCIQYEPIEISGERYLNFSVAFDRTPEFLYPLSFGSTVRNPEYYWHHIGLTDNDWWTYLVEEGQISTSFDNKPNDQGERILKSYVTGDRIIAYAKGRGAVGWGEIENPGSYTLIDRESPGDKLEGEQRHRLSIKWMASAAELKDGIEPKAVREDFDIYHPISTSVRIDSIKAQKLINELSKAFPKREGS
jgi:hypothetical protein